MGEKAIEFTKMHGLGNDFVIIDAAGVPDIGADLIRHICDRRRGIGCDQLIIRRPAVDGIADIAMDIYNADASSAEACGNATRCVGALAGVQINRDHVVVATKAGLCDVDRRDDGQYAVDMGMARLDWRDIPLAKAIDCLHVPVNCGVLDDGCAVNIGNPHIVFFVDDVARVPLSDLGPLVENHELFPERVNVEIIHRQPDGSLRLKVWERGAGITPACGTGACAGLVAAVRRSVIDGRRAIIHLDGGDLEVEWQKDDHVLMTGPCRYVFHGTMMVDADLSSAGNIGSIKNAGSDKNAGQPVDRNRTDDRPGAGTVKS